MKNQKITMRKRAGVSSGAPPDSEDDSEVSFGQRKRNKEEQDTTLIRGNDTTIMDEETRKQIAMLEELAMQMKAEKD
jgi:hypothetical protein